MASSDQAKNIQVIAKAIAQAQPETYVSRSEWGEFSFADVENEIHLALDLAKYLAVLPLEAIPATSAEEIRQRIHALYGALEAIQKFSLTGSPNPREEREALAAGLHMTTIELLGMVQTWIPFLAYRSGSMAKQFDEIRLNTARAVELIGSAKGAIAEKVKEAEGVLAAARSAASNAGVSVFTSEFANTADNLEKTAKIWLSCTGGFALLTLAFAWWSASPGLIPSTVTPEQFALLLSSKVVALIVLLTSTVWCGRLYKATMHQVATNRHRANALRTFQAFAKATNDVATRDAVLLETTRSIFALSPNGYLETTEAAAESSSKLLEIVKTAK